jgi:hypothetical protein
MDLPPEVCIPVDGEYARPTRGIVVSVYIPSVLVLRYANRLPS